MSQKSEIFDKDWWLSFIEKNNSFSKTMVYKDVISTDLQKILNDGVKKMLQTRFNRFDISNGFRLYQHGKEINDSIVRDLIENNKLDNQECIEEYCLRTFGDNFGIILNYGERYSDALAENILSAIQPLFDIVGTPPWGIELTTFIGNYGWTPLGIHTDERGENVLHFHLGPGKKKMYNWDMETYEKVAKGAANNKNIEPILEYAKEYEFASGDLYYMPWSQHHVGYSGEFSIGVTLWFNNPTRCSFSKLMIDAIKNLFLKNDETIIENQIDYIKNETTFIDFIKTLDISSETLNEPLIDFLRHSYTEYKKCLLSNGAWQNIPLRHHRTVDDSNTTFPDLEEKEIVGSKVFQISYEKIDSRLIIYFRGVRLSFKYFESLTRIIDEINSGNIIQVRRLIEEIDDLPEEVTIYFLKTLLNNRGAKINEPKTETILD